MGRASPHDYGRFAAFVILMPRLVFKEAPHGACLSGEFKEGFGNGGVCGSLRSSRANGEPCRSCRPSGNRFFQCFDITHQDDKLSTARESRVEPFPCDQ